MPANLASSDPSPTAPHHDSRPDPPATSAASLQHPPAGAAPPASSSGTSSDRPGLLGWFRQSLNPAQDIAPRDRTSRPRRDSSTLSADEALNISRANGTRPIPIPISESAHEGGSAVAEKEVPVQNTLQGRQRSNSNKYNSLGLITAFSGGPGSF